MESNVWLVATVWMALALVASLISIRLGISVALIGIWPLTHVFQFGRREGAYTTLLMSTGLTFGTISALFGLTNHIIDQSQYTILVTTVIASAVVPTLVAQRYFEPPAPAAASTPGTAIAATSPAAEI